ncbi:MAG: rod shape-determining protein MreD [Bacteroidota bacterium]
MPSPLRYVLLGLLAVLAQWLVFDRLRIFGAYPDVVLLYVAFLGFREGRLAGAIAGFSLGLLVDAVHGSWGVHMLIKTVMGFAVGFFSPQDNRDAGPLRTGQLMLAALMIALLHNGLLVIFYVVQAGTRNAFMIGALWIGAALYTAAVAGIATLFAPAR